MKNKDLLDIDKDLLVGFTPTLVFPNGIQSFQNNMDYP